MRIVSSINCMSPAMHEYEATKIATAQNEQCHRTHQSSAIYTPTHLAVSAGDALSSVQTGFVLTHETANPCLPLLASNRYERRVGNKRARDDLLLQDAFKCKRRPCLMPGFAAVNGMNTSPGLEHLGKPSPRKSGEVESLNISNVCYQSLGNVKLNSTLVGLRTENKLGHVDTTGFADRRTEKTVSILHEHSMKFVHTHLQQARTPLYGEKVAMRNHLKSNYRKDGANQDRLVAQAVINNREVNCMRPHSMFDIEGQISDAPCILPTALVEKKTSQEEYPVHTPCEAQQGKQSSSKPNSKVLVDVTNKFQVTATPDVKKHMEEDDTHRLSQRHKQIEFGKNTLGYEHYIELVPKSERKGKDPRTPNPKQVCSKRSWDGQIRKWRRLLHAYDPPAEDGEELAEDMTLLKSNKKNEKVELEKDDIDSKILNKKILSRLQESTVTDGTGGLVNKDDGLSIYEDWMDC